MGSGAWSATDYFDRARARNAAGRDAFDYSAHAKRSGQLRVHQTLDPQGLGLRESRDSAEHPDSNPIIISLDVTGSMDRVVRAIHRDLPHLFELLLGQKFISDPQILFAAVGDAACDTIPLQVGQFESDNRMDQNLENMILEGGGGGQMTESYELMMYIAARHTASDAWDKRKHKGYLFMIGDEMAYPAVTRKQIQKLVGSGAQADIPLTEIVAEVQQRYHFYFIVPGGAAHGSDQGILSFWKNLIGADHVISLQNPDDTSECIAMTIGVSEGAVSPAQVEQRLKSRGRVGAALEHLMQAFGALFGSDPNSSSPTVTPPTRRL